jgi:hypothetical protein
MIIYLPYHLSLEMIKENKREFLYLQKNYPSPEINGNEDKYYYLIKWIFDIYPKEKIE